MANIFDLSDDLMRLLDGLTAVEEARIAADAGGNPELAADLATAEDALRCQLAAVEGDLVDKADGYVHVIRTLTGEADTLKAASSALADKARSRSRAAERLKQTLLSVMQVTGRDRISGALYTLAVQASPPRVAEVDEAAALAAGLAAEVTSIKPDSRGIIAAWKANPDSVDGIASVEVGAHLRIR